MWSLWSTRPRQLFLLLMALIATIFVWAFMTNVDKSINLEGELAPEGRPVVVQSDVQGRVTSIMTHVGQNVTKGQRLFDLEPSDDLVGLAESQARVWQLMAQVERYKAQSRLSKNIAQVEGVPDQVIADQLVGHNAELSELEDQLSEIDEQIRSAMAQAQAVRALIPSIEAQISLSKTRHQMLVKLNEEKFEGELAVMEAAQSVADSKARLLENRARLVEIEGQVKGLKAARVSTVSSFKARASGALVSAQQELEVETARLDGFKEKVSRYVLEAPVGGMISRVGIDNPGEVAEFGRTLAELIPNGVPISFYGRARSEAISEIVLGTRARVTLVSMDTRRTLPLDGVVTHVDPDATEHETYGRFFGVRVSVQSRDDVRLIPGVNGTAFVHLGERTVIEYLAEPIVNALDTALSER